MRLLSKVAIVTGGAKGIGKAIAIGFVKNGASVAIIDTDENSLIETTGEINRMGGSSIPITGDVSNSGDVSKAVKATLDRFGSIDILVNNAGISCRVNFLELREEQWDRALRVNLKGTFLCSQKVALEMKKQDRGGTIINITSISGEIARPNTAAYVASKGAVKMLTKAMAVDLGIYKIRVNAIAPSYVSTPMTETLLRKEGYLQKLLERIPLGYIASPEDIVGPAVFLASEDSRFMTGAILFVDGGWLAM